MEECKVCGGKGFYFIHGRGKLSEKRLERVVCKHCEGRETVNLVVPRPYDYQELLKEENQRLRL